MADDRRHLIQACEKVEENSLYSAQTHFIIAKEKDRATRIGLQLVPSGMASVAGILLAVGLPAWLGVIPAAGGLITGVATFLGVNKQAVDHQYAGKLLTQLRHDSRILRETYQVDMTLEEFRRAVQALHDRYSAYTASLPMTDDDAFKKARAQIQSGIFDYDADMLPAGTRPALPSASPDSRDAE